MSVSSTIFQILGPSPVVPLQAHMNKAHECARALVPFFKAVNQQDWVEAEKMQQQIATLEHDADIIKKDLRVHLPNSLLMPVSRSDILEILNVQDAIANRAEDIAGIILGRHMQLPEPEHYMDFLARCIEAVDQANNVINDLDELFSTAFKGSIIDMLSSKINELDRLEQETDKAQVQIRYELFQIESQLPPVDVVFLYQIIQWIGDLADHSQSVGGRLQLLLAH